MINRDLDDGRTILIRQEDHAAAAGCFAEHWGNDRFAPSSRQASLVCAAHLHDTHYHELEAVPPVDVAQGRPFGHRQLPFEPWHLEALQRNIDSVSKQDAYAGALVSMHHTGLMQNRYGMIRSWRDGQQQPGSARRIRPELQAFIEGLEQKQKMILADLGLEGEMQREFDYRLLQVCDLLSLYICCDGYQGLEMQVASIGPVPNALASKSEDDLRLIPQDDGSIRMEPYPFDQDELEITLPVLMVSRQPGASEDVIRQSVLATPPSNLTFLFKR